MCWCSCPASARSATAPTTCARPPPARPTARCGGARQQSRSDPLFAHGCRRRPAAGVRPGAGAAHRAGDQRRRDLADGAADPLRRRQRARAGQAATASAARSSSCISSRSRRRRPNQRAGRCGRVSDGVCIRLFDEDDFDRRPAVHRARDPALVAGGGDPADALARPGGRRSPFRSSIRRRRRRSPTATRCCWSWARWTSSAS